ncbi:MAG: cofactor-independent phosphoglycerate mutase [Candidatus Omnitrophica bacterium]|nr:cofactor-independent phosphoglycerate mutase [Candidatus Omnitrophota bacterium]
MKYIIVIMDGAADRPMEELGGKTPLQAAKKDNIDGLAKKSRCGLFRTIPRNFSTGSAVANLSILGYDPIEHFHGRGVLEAAAMNVPLDGTDVAFRCNTICVSEDGKIKNHSAGHISSEEASVLIAYANEKLGSDRIVFHQGVSYRHLLVLKGGFSPDVKCYPPHDYTGIPYKELFVKPKNEQAKETAGLLNKIIDDSERIMEKHPVNIARAKAGKDMANMLWPWSPGKKPAMKTFQERFGIKGAVISAVDLIKGLGLYGGFDIINVQGATGLYNTNYEGKAEGCIRALENHDLVYVHVEAPDEASHEGDARLKVKCIEDIDRRLTGNILKGINIKNTAMAFLPDHYTPVFTKAHSPEPVPFMIYNPLKEPDSVQTFDETACASGSYGLVEDNTFINKLLGRGDNG